MNVNESLKELRKIKDVAMATVDCNGNPQVRIIDIMIVENNYLYFLTARGKNFYQELITNKRVAISAVNENYIGIRLNGIVERVEAQDYWRNRIFDDNPSMNNVYPGKSRKILDVFCIKEGEVEIFDLSVTPIERYQYDLQGNVICKCGYLISEACVSCGLCKQECPQQCIESAKVYKIKQNHCLHCGLCYEVCPIGAIKKVG